MKYSLFQFTCIFCYGVSFFKHC